MYRSEADHNRNDPEYHPTTQDYDEFYNWMQSHLDPTIQSLPQDEVWQDGLDKTC